MESATLTTASTYLNNLLLARGVLRNGKGVDFARPTRETRAQIINLVHDLVLGRDRDEETRERAADTIRRLRAEQARRDAELERLGARLLDRERALADAQVEVRNNRADLKTLNGTVRSLQSQLGKAKALAEQVKTQCVADLRKRDLQIEKLKSHLQGQQRGNKSLVVAPSIAVNGSRSQPMLNASTHSLRDPEYTLKQETNEFLTQLSESLSDENDGLLSLVNGTLHTLQALLGMPKTTDTDIDMEQQDSTKPAVTPPSYQALGAELERTMETLKCLLTNPNFVSVEEVDIRDEEIGRLREGWEKMEAQWKDVLLMMDGWRKRLEKSGDNVDLDELKRGLGFGLDFEQIKRSISPTRPATVVVEARSASAKDGDVDSDDHHDQHHHPPRDSGVSDMSERQQPTTTATQQGTESPSKRHPIDPPDFFDLAPDTATKGRPLRQWNHHHHHQHNPPSPRRRVVAFETHGGGQEAASTSSSRRSEDTEKNAGSGGSGGGVAPVTRPAMSKKPSQARLGSKIPSLLRDVQDGGGGGGGGGGESKQASRTRKRATSPTPPSQEPPRDDSVRSVRRRREEASPDMQLQSSSFLEEEGEGEGGGGEEEDASPPPPTMSLSEKLREAEREALAAAAAAAGKEGADADGELVELEMHDGVGALRSPVRKKTKIGARPKRRKSTLSPEELESLLGI